MPGDTSVWTVALAALATAVATGVGAIPFFFTKRLQERWLGVSNAIAAGLMLGASYGLLVEGSEYSVPKVVVGMAAGIIAIVIAHHFLGRNEEREVQGLVGADALKALMIVGVMTAHSFSEGIGVGVSFGGGADLGLLITIAIAVHNIPEGLAISLVLVPRGLSALRAAWWSVFSSLPQPLMAVPAFLFVLVFRPFLPVGLGFAAGAMIWMVFAELVPDALEYAKSNTVGTAVTVAIAVMILFQYLL